MKVLLHFVAVDVPERSLNRCHGVFSDDVERLVAEAINSLQHNWLGSQKSLASFRRPTFCPSGVVGAAIV